MQLDEFGLDRLRIVEEPTPAAGAGEVLVRHRAASINYRDYQICAGEFVGPEALPIVPCSDGAGEVVAVGDGVTELQPGDRVCALFFPEWRSGPALGRERAVSFGLEAPGMLREYGVYRPHQLVRIAAHLSDSEAACFPCAGLTAWTCVRDLAGIGTDTGVPGEQWVLLEGTGGVAMFGLAFARALGARTIVVSGHDAKLDRARALGAEHGINYRQTPDWGAVARDITGGRGVDCVVEIGGEGTLRQAVTALRRDGHIGVVGYLAGFGLGLGVFDLIERNAHLHGVSVGNRDACVAMMDFVEQHAIRPVIDRAYPFDAAPEALADIARGTHVGKLVVEL